ncbi:MoaD/ThiS family protein [Sphingosinicella sp. BN140058]|uniref:MoaD/ThiS family protein n=1 Tax=Sphingosinicella sp. BN140058 TaxID=1892855 RepID=UPI0013EC0E48|nr:MoaD/ThiS family protein [Sphingosinicella sp. BN140058]
MEASVKILLFGSLGQEIGREILADLPPDGCSVAALRQRLAAQDPAYGALARPSIRACVDQVIVAEEFLIRPGQEVAFVPPLSGG